MQHLLADGLCGLAFSQMKCVMITELIFSNILMLCAVLKAQRSCDPAHQVRFAYANQARLVSYQL